LSATPTLRAYGQLEAEYNRTATRIDTAYSVGFMTMGATKWYGAIALFARTIVMLGTYYLFAALKGNIDPGIAAFGMSGTLSVTGMLSSLAMTIIGLETAFNTVERLVEYIELEPEAPFYNEENKPPDDWPDQGMIEIKDISFKYREDLDYALRDLTFTIPGGEKVGIVGRTGAGKSSLIVCLFRIRELSEGQILIDGIDIATLGLYDLRSRIAVIPQEPTMFVGTVRSNLDPTHTFSDDEIWEVLEVTKLTKIVNLENGGLSMPVSTGGNNFSIGQQQVFCLCRVLLKKPQVVIMDEATASVDIESDRMIQTLVKERFQDATVLTVAHRLETVVENDLIVVLSQGRLKELDTPVNLIADQPKGGARGRSDTDFKRMILATGGASAKRLFELIRTNSQIDMKKSALKSSKMLLSRADSQQSMKSTMQKMRFENLKRQQEDDSKPAFTLDEKKGKGEKKDNEKNDFDEEKSDSVEEL